MKSIIQNYLVEEVTSGSVTVSVNYGDVSVIAETLDLCDLVTQIKLECPLKPSDKPIHFTSKTNTIPDYLPSVSCNECGYIIRLHIILRQSEFLNDC